MAYLAAVLHAHLITPASPSSAKQMLGSHFVASPLRDEAAVSLGTDRLPQLFAASLSGGHWGLSVL